MKYLALAVLALSCTASAAVAVEPLDPTCCARAYSPWPPPFAPSTPLRSPPQTPPQWASFASFAGFIATMTRSDFGLRLESEKRQRDVLGWARVEQPEQHALPG